MTVNLMTSFESLWFALQGLPVTVALAAVATIGYLVGRWRRLNRTAAPKSDELRRALEISRNLEAVMGVLRRDLASHYSEVERFKKGVQQASHATDDDEAWELLRGEADRVLTPTLQLAGQIAYAYEELRRQTQAISSFSGGRTDPLTGLSNRRALDELLEMELGSHAASQGDFCIAVLSVGPSAELPSDSRREQQERVLQAAELLKSELRDRDLAARYGADEFVVLMPHTRIYGACALGRRLRQTLSQRAGLIVNCGITQSRNGDSAKTLLARADTALYTARAEGDGQLYVHTGQLVRPDAEAYQETNALRPELATLKLVDTAAE